MCSNPDRIQTKSEKDNMVGGLAKSTTGGDSFNPDSIKKILDMMKSLLNMKKNNNRRRRRSTVANNVDLMTPQEVNFIQVLVAMSHL